jgi:hypothetical protein
VGLRGVGVGIPVVGDGWASTFITSIMGEEAALVRGGGKVGRRFSVERR